MHISLPKEIKLTCSENRSFAGIFSCSRSISRLWHTPSLALDLTQPNRRQTRQQWVSTGNTSWPSEYNITHRATLMPTPGNEIRNASHSVALIFASGASDSFPNLSKICRHALLISFDLVFDSPPNINGSAIALAFAVARSENFGNFRLSAS